MNSIRKLSEKDKRPYKVIIIVFVLICIAMSLLCFNYYQGLRNTVQAESCGYMQEISKQISVNVGKTINDNFAILTMIATTLESSESDSFELLQDIVHRQKDLWSYKRIILIDENGVAHDDMGDTVLLRGDQYLREAIVGGKNAMSTSQLIDGEESVAFAIPLRGVVIDGIKMHALIASYELETFDRILAINSFEGRGYAHIVRNDGVVIVRSSSPNALQIGYNILNSLSEAKIVSERQITEIKIDIKNGKSGKCEFILNDAHEYMMYTPLENEGWSLLTFVPVDVVNAKSGMMLKITLLACGVITFSFALLLGFLMLNFYRNKRRLEHIAYVDPVTQGNTAQRFYELASEVMAISERPPYALVYTNIEKFKVLNEQFGRNSCDELLRGVEYGIRNNLDSEEYMGRLFADNFCVLIKYSDEESLVARLDEWYAGSSRYLERGGFVWLPFIVEFGVYIIGKDKLDIAHIIDRAKLALTESSRELRGRMRYAIYDEQVRKILFREKQLEDMMGVALENHEFEAFLQPKYKIDTEQIAGAEALARWMRGSEMIHPDEFIPLFEKNGFIAQLDLTIFEQVCVTIRSWIDRGEEPLKISVNCSRMQLKNASFLQRYCKIADKYDVPHQYLEIELTENVVFEDVSRLSEIINEIHAAGFGCSMDDFGSGYSSLNLIKDIHVDTLKLDRSFFSGSLSDISRTESVVGSVVTMSKALGMVTVAEGVEDRIHVDMLKRLGCDYIQGYYYAKPMPIKDFETLTFRDESGANAD
ncbi:MAG: EAL domain-containing protein [Oscillospiraceae bacterium]